MTQRYLEVTYRNGKPDAGYLYLPRQPGDVSVRTERREQGLLIDFAADGRAIGIELTSPASVSLSALNEVLKETHHAPADRNELSPLVAA